MYQLRFQYVYLTRFSYLFLQDETLLGQKLHPKLGIATVTRLGEKKELQEIRNSFKEYIVDLGQLEYYNERRLKNLGLIGEQEDIILWEQKHPCSQIKCPIDN